jgi:predicted hydrocarbon binding protein
MAVDTYTGANYFAEGRYVKTNVKTGVARNRAGTRILSLTSDFLIGLRNALIFECGKSADTVMKSAGRKWGKQFAERLDKELGDHYRRPQGDCPLAMFQASLGEAFSHHGFGKLTIDVSLHDKGLISCVVENPVYCGLVDSPDQPTDSMLAGILAGLFSHYAGRELDCAQTQCQSCGAADSRFVVTLPSRLEDVESWRNDGKSHVEIVAALAQTRA